PAALVAKSRTEVSKKARWETRADAAMACPFRFHTRVLAGAQIVGIPGLQARPLGGGTSIGTDILLAFKPLWPAGRRVLPRLLTPVDGQVEQPVAVVHRLAAAPRRPVSLEDIGSLSQVGNDVKQAHPASNQESV